MGRCGIMPAGRKPKPAGKIATDKQCREFRSSAEWQKLALHTMQHYGYLCQECIKHGKVVKADAVHHIKCMRLNWELRNVFENLMPVCDECHKRLDNLSDKQRISQFMRKFDWED